MAISACDPLTASLGSAVTVGKLNGGLIEAIDRLDQAAHDHREQISVEVQDLIGKTREEMIRATRDVAVIAGSLEEKTSADLAGHISAVTSATELLTRDVAAAANDAIKITAEQARTLTLQLQNGPLREAKATVRLTLAKAERTGDNLILSVVSGTTVLALRFGGIIVLVIALIGVIVAAVKKRGLAVMIIVLFAALGLSLAVAAPWFAGFAAEKQTVLDPEESCALSLAAGVELEKGGPAAPAAAPIRGKKRAGPLEGAAKLGTRNPITVPSPAANDRPTVLVATILEHGPRCVAFSMSPQKADACERYINLALARTGVAVICTSAAQCGPQQECDVSTAGCLDRGVWCSRPDDCKTGKECDTSSSRCVDRGSFGCSGTNLCLPGEVCGVNRKCGEAIQVIGNSCPDITKQGPCQKGEWQHDGHGGVVCRSVVAAKAEECDGIDNDCDGTVDDVLNTATGCVANAMGTCRQGQLKCKHGAMICEPGVAQPERCNEKDDNCNGVNDDSTECEPQEMTGGTIECGFDFFGTRQDKEIGGPCAGFSREPVQVIGPQEEGRHAEFMRWKYNNADDCTAIVHCGTGGSQSGIWTVKITARKFVGF